LEYTHIKDKSSQCGVSSRDNFRSNPVRQSKPGFRKVGQVNRKSVPKPGLFSCNRVFNRSGGQQLPGIAPVQLVFHFQGSRARIRRTSFDIRRKFRFVRFAPSRTSPVRYGFHFREQAPSLEGRSILWNELFGWIFEDPPGQVPLDR
jgi:hypothetical protein